tara:strand:+ start:81 stop:275 length:195 start_codon:yes stop_codon:yes gene_type:complete
LSFPESLLYWINGEINLKKHGIEFEYLKEEIYWKKLEELKESYQARLNFLFNFEKPFLKINKLG